MAKKRRRSDKIRAKERLTTNKKRLATNFVKKPTKMKAQSQLNQENNIQQDKVLGLFNYDPNLIGQDLKKTLLITLVVLVVLALITLRYT